MFTRMSQFCLKGGNDKKRKKEKEREGERERDREEKGMCYDSIKYKKWGGTIEDWRW